MNYIHDSSSIGSDDTLRRGLLFVSSFRSNEVKDNDYLMERMNFIKESQKVNFTKLDIEELSKDDITKLISAKLCLPWRYTRELGSLVHSKTRGNPFYIIHFLKSILNKTLKFSLRNRCFVFDCDVIDMQVMPDGVAELLASRFHQLPLRLVQTLKILSCIGTQMDYSTIEMLNLNQQVLSFHMQDELDHAIHEGLLERAGELKCLRVSIQRLTFVAFFIHSSSSALQ